MTWVAALPVGVPAHWRWLNRDRDPMAQLLDRLLFAQGNKCFFCRRPLTSGQASVEHLQGRSHGGTSADGNVVACCRSVNALFAAMTVKEKLRVVLEQDGGFRCPAQADVVADAAADDHAARLAAVIRNLSRRGGALPRKLKSLTSTVAAIFGKRLDEDELQRLLRDLQAKGVVRLDGDVVVYSLPATGA